MNTVSDGAAKISGPRPLGPRRPRPARRPAAPYRATGRRRRLLRAGLGRRGRSGRGPDAGSQVSDTASACFGERRLSTPARSSLGRAGAEAACVPGLGARDSDRDVSGTALARCFSAFSSPRSKRPILQAAHRRPRPRQTARDGSVANTRTGRRCVTAMREGEPAAGRRCVRGAAGRTRREGAGARARQPTPVFRCPAGTGASGPWGRPRAATAEMAMPCWDRRLAALGPAVGGGNASSATTTATAGPARALPSRPLDEPRGDSDVLAVL